MGEIQSILRGHPAGKPHVFVRSSLRERGKKKKKDLAPRETRVFSSARQRLEKRKEVLFVSIAAVSFTLLSYLKE